jgi:cytochrome c biogenesis protein CcdA
MIPFLSALWFGILTSISPCPLATNIAAVSYLSRRIEHPKAVLASGAAYTAGRTVAYTGLGAVIIFSLAEIPAMANFFQEHMNRILGPLLVLVGLFLLNVINPGLSGFSISERSQKRLAGAGVWGSFALGFIFALSFCPISAALFFGSLIPLALGTGAGILLPVVYGIGTAIPVFLLAIALALGMKSVSEWFSRISGVEKYMRRITGVIFLAAGLYYIWTYLLPNIP